MVVFSIVVFVFSSFSTNVLAAASTKQPSVKRSQENPSFASPTHLLNPTPRIGDRPSLLSENNLSQAKTVENSGLLFIENRGQFDQSAHFRVQSSQGTIYLADNAIWLTVLESESSEIVDVIETDNSPQQAVNLRMSFENSNPSPEIEGFNLLDTKFSYFRGSNSATWHTNVPTWGGVSYQDIFPGYDLEVTGESGQLSWQFVAQAVSHRQSESRLSLVGHKVQQPETNTVRLKVEGADALMIEGGTLRITTAVGDVLMPLPTIKSATAKQRAPQGLQPNSINQEAYIDGNEVVFSFTLPAWVETAAPAAYLSPTDRNSDTELVMISAKASFSNHSSLPKLLSADLNTQDLLYSTYLGGSSNNWVRNAIPTMPPVI